LAGWTRDVVRGGTMATFPGVPLVVLLTSSINDHLEATCGYRYLDRIGPVELHGRFDSRGKFWPIVEYQVPSGPNKWRTTAQSPKSSDATAIKIDSITSHAMLLVDMEPFRPLIGKYQWGRIVLENGESAMLSLYDLLQTADDPSDANYKSEIRDENPHRFGSVFSLIAVICFSGHLTGEFAVLGADRRYVGEIVGRQDSNGDFSPVVTWQAGNSNQDWHTVEESPKLEDGTTLKISTENPAQSILVDLDPYRLLIGRFKYGKIVFSNGDYSVFELDSLKPSYQRASGT